MARLALEFCDVVELKYSQLTQLPGGITIAPLPARAIPPNLWDSREPVSANCAKVPASASTRHM